MHNRDLKLDFDALKCKKNNKIICNTAYALLLMDILILVYIFKEKKKEKMTPWLCPAGVQVDS